MVRRFKDSSDNRKVLVEANHDGAMKLTTLYRPFSKKILKTIEGFTDEQLKTILEYKKAITEILDSETKKNQD